MVIITDIKMDRKQKGQILLLDVVFPSLIDKNPSQISN
jgi:hypothetical protein